MLQVDCAFLVDIIFSFVTGYFDAGHFIKDHRQIAVRYMRSWFVLDFVSSLPLDFVVYLFDPNAGGSGELTALKGFRLIKVLRVMKLASIAETIAPFLSQLAYVINPALKTLGLYVLWLFYAWHFVGCMYWRVAYPPGSTAWGASIDYATRHPAEQHAGSPQ